MEKIVSPYHYFAVKAWHWPEQSRLGQAALLLALLIIVLSPFNGGGRLPSFLLIALGGVLLWKKQGTQAPPQARQRLTQVLLLIGLPILLSAPTSVHVTTSLLVAVAVALYGLMGLSLLWMSRIPGNLEWLERGIGLCLLLWLVDGWIQYLFGHNLLGIPLSEDGRVVGFFHKLRLSIFLSVLAPLLLWRLARSSPWLAWLLYGLLTTIVILSGARASWVMVALAGGLLFFQAPHGWKTRLAVAMMTAILVISVVTTSELVRVKLVGSIGSGTLEFAEFDRITTGRVIIWETGMRMMLDRPLVGVGAGAFIKAYDAYSARDDDRFRSNGAESLSHAHQLYVAVAAETGLIGLAGLIAIWWLCLRWYWQGTTAQRARASPWGAALFIAAFPLNSQPVLLSMWWFPVLLLLLSAFLGALSSPDAPADDAIKANA